MSDSPLKELQESNIPVWEMLGNYTQPSESELGGIVAELRAEREEWEQKQDAKEA